MSQVYVRLVLLNDKKVVIGSTQVSLKEACNCEGPVTFDVNIAKGGHRRGQLRGTIEIEVRRGMNVGVNVGVNVVAFLYTP